MLPEWINFKETKGSVETLKFRQKEENSFSFVVLGDSSIVPGCGQCQGNVVLTELVRKINENKPGFVVYTGDGPEQGGPILSLEAFRQALDKLKVPWYPVLGNHEIIEGAAADGGGGDGEENYLSVFKDKLPVKDNRGKRVSYYSFNYFECHFIVLNTAWQHRKESGTKGLYPGGAQWEWLVSDLQGARRASRHIFIFTHEPPLLPGIFRLNSRFTFRDRGLNTTWNDPRAAAGFLQLCRVYGVEAVFSGHFHGYLKFKDGATTHIISGGAGSSLHVPALLGGYYHYVLCTVSGEQVTWEAVRLN
ncbi:MAG: Calcineurin-like phosphoesterase [Firmicutes bacterium ADurb.Bin456]|nr:MAG: Calcineurin-like phosphoesterase [Firmicutes bacterium ADurb.Bin456]